MMFQFFWSRTASVWIAVLYIALGLPLLLFPAVSGSVFVWSLATGAAVYAISHLWRYIQGHKTNSSSSGDLFLFVLPMAFSIFSLFWPGVILSFLPLVLGALLLVDGVGKVPLVISVIKAKESPLVPLLLSSLIPLVLGIVLIINPFQTAQLVIMIFGAALVADGVSDLFTALLPHRQQATVVDDHGSTY